MPKFRSHTTSVLAIVLFGLNTHKQAQKVKNNGRTGCQKNSVLFFFPPSKSFSVWHEISRPDKLAFNWSAYETWRRCYNDMSLSVYPSHIIIWPRDNDEKSSHSIPRCTSGIEQNLNKIFFFFYLRKFVKIL